MYGNRQVLRHLGFLHAVVVPHHAHGRLVDAEALGGRDVGQWVRLALREAGVLRPAANAAGMGSSWPAANRAGLLAEGQLEPGAGACHRRRAAQPQPQALVAIGADLGLLERWRSAGPPQEVRRTAAADGLPLPLLQLALAPGALVLLAQLVGRLVEGEVRRRIGIRTGITEASLAGVDEGRHIELGVGAALVLRAPHRNPADVLQRHLRLVHRFVLLQILSLARHLGHPIFVRIVQRLHATHLVSP